MRLSRLSWSVVALGCALPGLVFAALSASQAKVTFSCSGPGGLKFEAVSNEIQAADKGDALVVTVPVEKFSTGIGVRDTRYWNISSENSRYSEKRNSIVSR